MKGKTKFPRWHSILLGSRATVNWNIADINSVLVYNSSLHLSLPFWGTFSSHLLLQLGLECCPHSCPSYYSFSSHSPLEQLDLKAKLKEVIWLNPTNFHGYLVEREKGTEDIWIWKPSHFSPKSPRLYVQWTIKTTVSFGKAGTMSEPWLYQHLVQWENPNYCSIKQWLN